MATKRKPRRTKKVKAKVCRAHGSVMSTSKNKKARSSSAGKLASKSCKTRTDVKKSTSKVKKITALAKKIHAKKKGGTWAASMRQAAKQLK